MRRTLPLAGRLGSARYRGRPVMLDDPIKARLALAQVEGLKRQFDALAQKHFNLSHIYLEHPEDGQPLISFPSSIGRCVPYVASAPYIPSHAIYHDGAWRRLTYKGEYFTRQCAGWYHGECISEFERLALSTDSFLTTFPVRVPMPPAVTEIADLSRDILPNPIILPCGFHRWARILHWLAWSGSVMASTPLCCVGGPWKSCEPSLDPALLLSSIIDNLFLRSSLALDWIALQSGLVQPDPERGRGANAIDEALEPKRWLTVSEAAIAAGGVNKGVISNAANDGTLRSNGKKGNARRIDAVDLAQWSLKRANRSEPSESVDHVERLMREARRQ